MKLQLEGSFPSAAAALLSSPFLIVEREGSADLSDSELVRKAAERQCNGIVFLGPQTLGRPEVLGEALSSRISIVATETGNPISALTYLAENIGPLTKAIASQKLALLVQSTRVIELDPTDLLEKRLATHEVSS